MHVFCQCMLCLMYNFLSKNTIYYLVTHEYKYGLLYQFLTSERIVYFLANQSYLSKLYFKVWDNQESSKDKCGDNL